MPFVTVPGLKGKIYVPQERRESAQKHPCKDCYACQQCSDDRCRVCRQSKQGCCTDKADILKEIPASSTGVAECACGVMD
jgi:hypothetical protein